mmetsp:Transcript_16502/g.46047  ORF Transcript_16502/g.46047 Transcript_16502/m.46047 type:complete len:259 (+) Transcript_16502:1581-2357(+)
MPHYCRQSLCLSDVGPPGMAAQHLPARPRLQLLHLCGARLQLLRRDLHEQGPLDGGARGQHDRPAARLPLRLCPRGVQCCRVDILRLPADLPADHPSQGRCSLTAALSQHYPQRLLGPRLQMVPTGQWVRGGGLPAGGGATARPGRGCRPTRHEPRLGLELRAVLEGLHRAVLRDRHKHHRAAGFLGLCGACEGRQRRWSGRVGRPIGDLHAKAAATRAVRQPALGRQLHAHARPPRVVPRCRTRLRCRAVRRAGGSL